MSLLHALEQLPYPKADRGIADGTAGNLHGLWQGQAGAQQRGAQAGEASGLTVTHQSPDHREMQQHSVDTLSARRISPRQSGVTSTSSSKASAPVLRQP